ncbi:MAG: hypothetical protein A3J83_09040 [Elusimicrobia bacterium RIFOXYA2_FULL_40_6]|nr:MAG: hypothetical protein A3J83_09040 [Elusimicrobia bacterium RIFOXYA2_FULL_40_6]
MNYDEKDCILKAKQNDVKALEQLISNYRVKTLNLAFKIVHNKDDAEDIAQEAFVKVFRSIYKLQDDTKFPNWLYRIVVNLCFAYFNKKKILDDPLEDIEFHEKIVDKGDSPESIVLKKYSDELIQESLRKLHYKYQTVLNLFYYNELSYSEISDIMDLSEGTVKTYLFRAKEQLKLILSQE